jgi:hypothetical protein
MPSNPIITPPDLPLRDIHLPSEIGWWPVAPGWWLLLGLLALLPVVAWCLLVYRRRRRLRRLALLRLSELSSLPEGQLVRSLSRLLRQAAISHFPRHETAGLCGEEWLAFLDRSFVDKPFSTGIGRSLIDAPYQPIVAIDSTVLIKLCRRWLKKLPPQQLSFRRGR